MRQKIRLTERQLHRVIQESVQRILQEVDDVEDDGSYEYNENFVYFYYPQYDDVEIIDADYFSSEEELQCKVEEVRKRTECVAGKFVLNVFHTHGAYDTYGTDPYEDCQYAQVADETITFPEGVDDKLKNEIKNAIKAEIDRQYTYFGS